MSENSEPRQLENSTAGRELIPLSPTNSDGNDDLNYHLHAFELSRLLLSSGHPESVIDLSSKCTYFQGSPNLVKYLCSIPNSPISLAEDGFTVTLSPESPSAPASFACSLDLQENVVLEQFMDPRSLTLKHSRGTKFLQFYLILRFSRSHLHRDSLLNFGLFMVMYQRMRNKRS